MAAKSAVVSLPPSVWTQLTDSDITACSLQNVGNSKVRFMATIGAVAPATTEGPTLMPNEAIQTVTMATAFPHAANTRIYAISPDGPGEVYISHA